MRPRSPGSESERDDTDLLDQTISVWQPHAARLLNREDARQIVENVLGFFQILQQWDRAERAAADLSSPPPFAPRQEAVPEVQRTPAQRGSRKKRK